MTGQPSESVVNFVCPNCRLSFSPPSQSKKFQCPRCKKAWPLSSKSHSTRNLVLTCTCVGFLALGWIFVTLSQKSGRAEFASAIVSQTPDDSFESDINNLLKVKFPDKPQFGDVEFGSDKKSITYAGRIWSLDKDESIALSFRHPFMASVAFENPTIKNWRVGFAFPQSEGSDKQWKYAWWVQKFVDDKWIRIGPEVSFFINGDIWETFHRTEHSYIRNSWDKDGKKVSQKDCDTRIIGPRKKRAQSNSEAEIQFRSLIAAEDDTFAFAVASWPFVLESVNQFHHNAEYDPPIDIRWTLSDSPTGWSACEISRELRKGTNKDELVSRLTGELFDMQWKPMQLAIDDNRDRWDRNEIESGESEFLEWTFSDKSDSKNLSIEFRFHLRTK